MAWMCKNGHLVKHQWQADQLCSKCNANARRRKEPADAKAKAAKAATTKQ